MDEKRKLVVWGASGHAAVVADVVRSRSEYEIVGFLDDSNPARKGTYFCGARVLGTSEELEEIRHSGVDCLIPAFGDCRARIRVCELARGKGFDIAKAIHSAATIGSDVNIGDGSVVVAGAVINAGARVDQNVIVNTCASVDHHCMLEDGVHVAPGARLAGNVRVGRAAWIGIGAVVIENVRVGAGAIVGAGAVVVGDVPEGVVAYGVPARTARKVDE